jgi:hypothetical protein
MSSVVIFRAPRVMIAIGLIVTFMGNASASPNTLTVQDPRPVAKAIQELDKRYGWQLTTRILHIVVIAICRMLPFSTGRIERCARREPCNSAKRSDTIVSAAGY